jgi:hypothetical protein
MDRFASERVFITGFFATVVFLLGEGLRSARHRDYRAHREWMIRKGAAALVPITQRAVSPVLAVAFDLHNPVQFGQGFVEASPPAASRKRADAS